METTTNKKYIIQPLAQGSAEWLEYRRSRIGSSEIPAIMGVCPYGNEKSLLMAKLGEQKAISEYTKNIFQIGHDIEFELRNHLQDQMNIGLTSPVVESVDNPRHFASIDLFNDENKFYGEVKSTGSAKILEMISCRIVPDNYLNQMNWSMGILGIDTGNLYVVDRNTGDTSHLTVPFNSKLFTQQKIMADAFLRLLDDAKKNNLPQIIALQNIAAANKRIKRVQKLLDTYSDNVKREAEKLIGDLPVITGAGIKIEYVERKGSVAYELIPELKTVDLERYRKPTTRYIKITEEKQKQIGDDRNE